MTPARTVVFDLDGTLVDTAPDLDQRAQLCARPRGPAPGPAAFGAQHDRRRRPHADRTRPRTRGPRRQPRTRSTRLTADFIDHYAAHIADASRPFDGLEGALDDLAARGYRFAVCTNKLEWLSKRLLDQLGLSARFSAICGADTFGVSKPDPAILRQTVARAGGQLSSAIMVGDAGPDIGVARRAGIPVIGGWIWLYRSSDRRSQTRSADRPHARFAGRGGKPDAPPDFPLSCRTSDKH